MCVKIYNDLFIAPQDVWVWVCVLVSVCASAHALARERQTDRERDREIFRKKHQWVHRVIRWQAVALEHDMHRFLPSDFFFYFWHGSLRCA